MSKLLHARKRARTRVSGTGHQVELNEPCQVVRHLFLSFSFLLSVPIPLRRSPSAASNERDDINLD